MNWLALDIGGANLKVADGRGYAASYPFALWQKPDALTQQLRRAIAEAPRADHVAATMTGELADCFATKQQGVSAIIDAVEQATDGRHTRVYTLDGALVAPRVARERHTQVAAANWHALAQFCGRFLELGPGLLIDVGSTTCDLIVYHDGLPSIENLTDTERLIAGELVYTGVERSPLCALLDAVPYRNHLCPVAQEWFATTKDIYIILGQLAENPTDRNTADGQPATKRHARVRLGRVICADHQQFNHRDAVAMAQAAAHAQSERLVRALERLLQRHDTLPRSILLSGHGEFLAKDALDQFGIDCPTISLRQVLGKAASRSATAHALAVLAEESSGP